MMHKNISKISMLIFLSLFCNEVIVAGLPPTTSCDFLSVYTNTPEPIHSKIHFEECEITNQQIAWVTARYRVEVQDVVEVERYFANTYGVPAMKWIDDICYDGRCIMSNAGYGGLPFRPEKANKSPDDVSVSFRMGGYYDMYKVADKQTLNREHIKHFTIEISIAQNP